MYASVKRTSTGARISPQVKQEEVFDDLGFQKEEMVDAKESGFDDMKVGDESVVENKGMVKDEPQGGMKRPAKQEPVNQAKRVKKEPEVINCDDVTGYFSSYNHQTTASNVEDGDFPEDPNWLLVGRSTVAGLSTCRGKKLDFNEIVLFAFPSALSAKNKIVRFSTKRSGEVGYQYMRITVLQGALLLARLVVHTTKFDNLIIASLVGFMENEALESSSNRKISCEYDLQDMDDTGKPFMCNTIPKLQFRKDISKSRWHKELKVSEVIEKKGAMWKTTGIIRGGRLYCSIEETLFLAEKGALLLLDIDDTILSLRDMYEMVAEETNGCSWESFKAFRKLKSLGYIVGRHGIPWILKDEMSCFASTYPREIQERYCASDNELEENSSIDKHLRALVINELRPSYDVHLPNSNFKKSSPGDPDFILCLARDPPLKVEIEDLVRRCNGVPVKICNVEHELVSFFEFNSTQLPVLP